MFFVSSANYPNANAGAWNFLCTGETPEFVFENVLSQVLQANRKIIPITNVSDMTLKELFKMEPTKANKTLKAIKGQQSSNIPAVMQQNNLVYNAIGMRLNGEVQTAPNWSISGEAGYERGKKGHGYSAEVSVKYTW